MATLTYTLAPYGGATILGGSYIGSALIYAGTHTVQNFIPTALIDIAVNASAQIHQGWTLKYYINGRDQTPEGAMRAIGDDLGTANGQYTRPYLP